MPHAIIIGAGPAGSIAALALARARWRVTLIEQSRFPRDKVCGECVSALGIEALRSLGLLAALERHRPVALRRAVLHAMDGESAAIELAEPMWGLSRQALDSTLLEQAIQAGADLLQPARAQAVRGGAAPAVEVRELLTNRCSTLAADAVLIADGKAALLAERPTATGDFGLKTHFANVDAPIDAIGLFGVRGHYGGVAPIEGERWNAAFSVGADLLHDARGDLDALFARIISSSAALSRQFRQARRCGEWLASPLPRHGVVPDWPQNVIPIGNAAAALEPIGGEGMGLAMHSARLAAHCIVAGGSPGALRREFIALWRSRRLACRLTAKLMSSPLLCPLAVTAARVPDQVGALFLPWLGK
jgi:flavin-dependent dehydrogenase